MNKHQKMVEEFMKATGQYVPSRPTFDGYPADLRVDLIYEESEEFADAVYEDDECKLEWDKAIDALADLLYVTYGAASTMGIDIEPFFEEVHRANMEKVGGPVREDGKILKPPNWKEPDIKGILDAIIRRHENQAKLELK